MKALLRSRRARRWLPAAMLTTLTALGPLGCGGTGGPAVSGGGPPAAVVRQPAVPDGDTAPAAERRATGTGCYLGVVLPSQEVDVVAEAAGRVRAVAVRPGDAVAGGALLATVAVDGAGEELRIGRAGLAAAESRLAELEVEVRRARQEHRQRQALGDLLSRAAVEAAAFELEATARRRDAARAEVEREQARVARLEDTAGRSAIRAPFAGRVTVRHVDPGAVVSAGTPVIHLIGRGARRLRFAVPPAEVDDLDTGRPLRVELESGPPLRRATLSRVAPEIDAASQMVFVEARLEDAPRPDARLAAGAIVRVSPADADADCSDVGEPEPD